MESNFITLKKNKGIIFDVISKPWDLYGKDVVCLQNLLCCYAANGLTKVEGFGR